MATDDATTSDATTPAPAPEPWDRDEAARLMRAVQVATEARQVLPGRRAVKRHETAMLRAMGTCDLAGVRLAAGRAVAALEALPPDRKQPDFWVIKPKPKDKPDADPEDAVAFGKRK